MPVLMMNIPCTITPKRGNDVYGMPIDGIIVKTRCAIVKMKQIAQHTTVRADSGATRGHADEAVIDAVLLLPKEREPVFDSVISVIGKTLRVSSVTPRFTVMGRLDHYEVGCSIE